MRSNVSLQAWIILAFICFCSVLILGYSFLSAHFFSRGIDSVLSGHMELVVRDYLRSIPVDKRNDVVTIGSSRISNQWKFMPRIVQNNSKKIPQPFELVKVVDESFFFEKPKLAYFVKAIEENGEVFYISQSINIASIPGFIGWNSRENIRNLLVLGCVVGSVLAIFIWLILKQISLPVSNLHRWARELDKESLDSPLPDFHYKELDDLAVLVKNSIYLLHQSVEKEKKFLGYASHELRSPMTVFTQNVELLEAMHSRDRVVESVDMTRILGRLGRASTNMKHIVETLLWLNKDACPSPTTETFCLKQLIERIVENDRYLMHAKDMSITLKCEKYQLIESEMAVQIVISNIIRNAFNYTFEGTIEISQSGTNLSVVNINAQHIESAEGLGFGLGLQLVSQVTKIMGWEYNSIKLDSGRKVEIDFCRKELR